LCLKKAEAEARAAASANSASTGDPAAAAAARNQNNAAAAANGGNDGADSSVSSSLSQSSRRVAPPLWPAAKMAPKPAAAPLWPQSAPGQNEDASAPAAAEKERGPSPDRAALAGSGVAKRAAAAVHAMMAKENAPALSETDREPRKRPVSPRESRSRPSSREPSPRPPSRQNDADSQIASGALIRAAESFGQSMAGNKNGGPNGRKSTENDSSKAVAPGAAKSRLHKFEQAAQVMMR